MTMTLEEDDGEEFPTDPWAIHWMFSDWPADPGDADELLLPPAEPIYPTDGDPK